MPTNIEIKARAADWDAQLAIAEGLSGGPPSTIAQRDTFFRCAFGRLKMRHFADGSGELIFYRRENATTTKESHYEIVGLPSASPMTSLLEMALGVDCVVTKTRLLFLVGQTRLHFDTVEGLGQFIELEVVMDSEQPAAEGHEIAQRLMHDLRIGPACLIDVAYADLLSRQP